MKYKQNERGMCVNMMHNMTQETFDKLGKIMEKIEEFETIIIHRHKKPDPDALGSQGGLQKLIQQAYPEKNVFVVGDEIAGLTFLNAMDTIEKEIYQDALVIVCDTSKTDRISDERYALGKYLIKIDHHPDEESYGHLEWVDTTYSSASEMITVLSHVFQNKLVMNDEAARLLYAGVVGDTGRFKYSSTDSLTFDVASKLVAYNFKPQEIYEEFGKQTRNEARLKGYVLQHFSVTERGVAHMYITKEIMEEFDVNVDVAANLVGSLADIVGNHIWVLFIEDTDKTRVRIRSKEVVINKVAMEFGGGGHPLASGASVENKEEAAQLIKRLNSLL